MILREGFPIPPVSTPQFLFYYYYYLFLNLESKRRKKNSGVLPAAILPAPAPSPTPPTSYVGAYVNNIIRYVSYVMICTCRKNMMMTQYVLYISYHMSHTLCIRYHKLIELVRLSHLCLIKLINNM